MPRSFRHWTPRYLKNRIMQLLHEKIHSEHPWLTKQSVNILSELLHDTDKGIEFGSGKSTLWFAKKTAHLISVEHDLLWYQHVNNKIKSMDYEVKVDYRHCSDMIDYVAQIDTLEDYSMDYCLVDGKERGACALKLLPKLKPEGILIIDNANLYLPSNSKSPNSIRQFDVQTGRDWISIQEQTDSWERFWTTNGVSDTVIWVKP